MAASWFSFLEAEKADVRNLLQSWPLAAYLKAYKADERGTALVLDVRDTVRVALDKLARRGVLAAPVLDRGRAQSAGWFGIHDALSFFLASNSEELMSVRHQIGPANDGGPGEQLLRSGARAMRTSGRFADRTLGSLLSRDSAKNLSAVDLRREHLTVLDVVLGAMSPHRSGWPGCHRVAVCKRHRTSDGWWLRDAMSVLHIISQTDICRLLLAHAHLLPIMVRTVSELGLMSRSNRVVGVWENKPALDAYALMLEQRVSALGIFRDVDGKPILVDNLSTSDLRVVLPDRWGVLALPVSRVIELVCSIRPRPRGVVAVRPESTLYEALVLIVQCRLHHVFVTTAEGGPMSVISTSDILRALCHVR
jgi:CBS domain-containing protein